jgi:hypothetical protein
MPLEQSTALGLAQMGIGGIEALISGLGMKKATTAAEKGIEGISTYKADPELLKALQMRQARLGMGLGATTRQIAQQGIGTAAATATKAAQMMGKGAGLSSIGAIQKQSERGYQQLALQEEAAQERSRQAYERAAGVAASEKYRQFASEQEKQQLKANIALEKLAARRAMLAQGLSGLTGGASGMVASGGYGGGNKQNPKQMDVYDYRRAFEGTFK